MSEMHSWLASIALGIGMACAATSAAAEGPEADPMNAKVEDPCDLALDDIVLLSSTRKGEAYLGLFELRLSTFADSTEPFTIGGTRSKKVFRVDWPEARFEFRDLTGAWRDPFIFIADFFESPPDRMTIAHGGGRAQVAVQLPSPDIAAQAIEWRLILRSIDNKQCLRSIPFQVVQSRGPVRGFASGPIPERLKRNQITSPSPSDCGQSVTPQPAPFLECHAGLRRSRT